MKRSISNRALAVVVAAQFLSCGPKPSPQSGGSGAGSGGGGGGGAALVQDADVAPGLTLRVSDGKQGPPARDRSKLAPATPLSDAAVQKILARVAPVAAQPGDKVDFALRDRSQPPPRTGKTLKGAFPPPDPFTGKPPTTNDAGKPLAVLRHAPEGDVPIAPQLQITFSQPMVAVTSQDDAARTVPVTLTPTPPGRWRWLGTRTLIFDPEVRFPQATTYQVEIPKGTRSATGNQLADAKRFTFTTPAPRLISSWPNGGPQRLDVPMFAMFDQRVDPAAVLATIQIKAGGKRYGARLLSDADLAKHEVIKELVDAAKANQQDGRWLVFAADAAFPKDTHVEVRIGPGTPSREGPNKTKDAQTFSFDTYPPLKIVRSECGWGECPPGAPFVIEFNNPLDSDKWDDAQLTLSPEVPRAKIIQNREYLTVQGATKGKTKYQVRVSGGVVDEFGQTLGKDALLTFKVGKAHPNFYGPSGLIALDPVAKQPTFDVFTTNYDGLKVKLYKVAPTDFDAFAHYLRNQWKRTKPRLPGKKVFDQLVRIKGAADDLTETRVDLSPALAASKLGHVIAVVEPTPWKERYDPPRLVTWIQSTRLAVDVAVDADEMHAWVNQLADGAPVGGATLSLLPWGIAGKTDDTGSAELALSSQAKKGANLLIARKGDDLAFVPDGAWYGDYGQWRKQDRPDSLSWYVIDDRQMYRPGEKVHLKGWLRVFENREGGDLAAIAGQVSSVTYKVVDPVGNEMTKGSARVSSLGGFDLAFELPKTPNLGYASVYLEAKGRMKGTAYHSFQIQEFRRPEYEVSAQASQGPHLIGGSADVTVTASYFAGGGLTGADVNWYLNASRTSYTPPNRDDFTFGLWQPWWGWGGRWWDQGDDELSKQKSWSHTAKTDATGAHVLHLDLVSARPAVPMSVSANASVTDVNRQQWSANATLLVHPSALYVGLRTPRPFVDKGQPIELQAIAVDLDGKAVAGKVLDIGAVRLDWDYVKGKYVTKEVDPQSCSPTSAADPVSCEFATPEGGQYKISAVVVDDQGRRNRTEMTVWVSGGKTPPARQVEQEQIQLIPDQKQYQAGDQAKILIQSPFAPAEGVLSIRRSGIVSTKRFTMTGPSQTVTVPITDAQVPNVYVQVDLVGSAPRVGDDGQPDPSLPQRPAYAVGVLDLPVPPKQRTLAIKVAPRAAKVAPGAKASFDVAVTDAAGKPVKGAEVALIVVDEAVLSLTGHTFANPLDIFYGERSTDASDAHLRSYVKLTQPDADQLALGLDKDGDAIVDEEDSFNGGETVTLSRSVGRLEARNYKTKNRVALAEGKMGGKQAPAKPVATVPAAQPGPTPAPAIAVRTNFNPLAAFAPEVATGADGKATLNVTMPDNLTRYRVVAVAAAGARHFGKGESAITARMPLMVRPSPPRFLNFGDTFELPVVLQNQTDKPMQVEVAVRATNAALTAGAGRAVSVPANDRVEVRFPAAAELAGTARFQLAAVAGPNVGVSDAAEVALPVWTPATTEAFATYGQIDSGAVRQPVTLPGKVVTQFGGLEVETSSTQLQALTDAFLYLVSYPFECSEQLSSRIAGIAALRDVLTAFKAEGLPPKAALEARVGEDLERLYAMQNGDGGFPFWKRGYDSWPYLTVHVTNAMVRAKAKGFTVEQPALDRALDYLRTIERRFPSYYSMDVRRTITAYALYTRTLAGDRDVARATGLLKEAGGVDKLSMEAVGWLLGTMAQQADAAAQRKAILRHLQNKVSETAAAANFTTGYGDGAYLLLHSDRRVDAVILESLIAEKRTSDLIPKLVVGLLGHAKAGRWANTQENVFVLFALDRYFHEFEKVTPDFVARVWLGDGYAGDHAFKGRQTDRHLISIPMKVVADKAGTKPADLVIAKQGKGRLYYRIGMTYAPANLKLEAADYGFTVARRYEAVDDPADVVRGKDGTWKIKAGARVRVRVSMVAENRRYHVALVDPLPAGLEAMNPALAVTGPIPQDPKAKQDKYWWWTRTWYEHQNLRDERVEAFTSLLWSGVHEYTYVARATTPGNFVVPPAKAEEMYFPETFGRSASDRVVVE